MSYETYALVRDIVRARPLAPVKMKGISRETVAYVVEGLLSEVDQRVSVISKHAQGLDIFLDIDVVDGEAAELARQTLQDALAALEAHQRLAGTPPEK
jgi:hypothetical protein